nr:MAG TPA: hypothetical protein [Caudoviricetes sp.]
MAFASPKNTPWLAFGWRLLPFWLAFGCFLVKC